jgi:hypothetical protein
MELENLELLRHPKALYLPPREYPPAVAEAVADYDDAYLLWDMEHAALEDLNRAYQTAEREAVAKMVEAAKTGKKDPGESKDVDAAKRAVLFQNERVKHLRKEADKKARATFEAMQAERLALLEMAVTEAEGFAADYPGRVADVSKQLDQIVTDRQKAYELLRVVSQFTEGTVSYDPSFPLEGNVSLFQTHERRVWGLTKLLREMFLDTAKEKQAI